MPVRLNSLRVSGFHCSAPCRLSRWRVCWKKSLSMATGMRAVCGSPLPEICAVGLMPLPVV